MPNHKILNIASPHVPLQNELSKSLGISDILAQLLINRGIRTSSEARRFLDARLEDLLDPRTFTDMDKAVELVRAAARKKEAVLLFGDYDVDGITSLALLKDVLARIGLQAEHYIPHRIREGYGLNREVIGMAKEKGIGLLITVDCGTNSHEVIRELRNRKVEVIVTDHHEPSQAKPPVASALINPKVKGSGYGFRELAGVGVAYKFAQAIAAEPLVEELDLVALGTIADVVGLVGENRIIVKEGLKRLSRTTRPGLQALMEQAGMKKKICNTTSVAYIIGPRLNASGRMDTAEAALQLLLCKDRAEAEKLARTVESFNRQRQKVEAKILEEAQALIDKEVNFKEHKIIVVAKEDWHQGVLGVVASKLAEKFYRPTILISKSGILCKGSGRSIKNFHLFQALMECKDFLETFGGHSHAAGILIDRKNIAEFRERINRLAKERLKIEDLIPTLEIDMELGLERIDEALVRELEALEPFGTGNPEPLFYARGLTVKGESQVLGRYTLKFWVTDGAVTFQAIGFGMGGLQESVAAAKCIDMVYSPQIDSWQGEDKIVLEVRDIFVRS